MSENNEDTGYEALVDNLNDFTTKMMKGTQHSTRNAIGRMNLYTRNLLRETLPEPVILNKEVGKEFKTLIENNHYNFSSFLHEVMLLQQNKAGENYPHLLSFLTTAKDPLKTLAKATLYGFQTLPIEQKTIRHLAGTEDGGFVTLVYKKFNDVWATVQVDIDEDVDPQYWVSQKDLEDAPEWVKNAPSVVAFGPRKPTSL